MSIRLNVCWSVPPVPPVIFYNIIITIEKVTFCLKEWVFSKNMKKSMSTKTRHVSFKVIPVNKNVIRVLTFNINLSQLYCYILFQLFQQKTFSYGSNAWAPWGHCIPKYVWLKVLGPAEPQLLAGGPSGAQAAWPTRCWLDNVLAFG